MSRSESSAISSARGGSQQFLGGGGGGSQEFLLGEGGENAVVLAQALGGGRSSTISILGGGGGGRSSTSSSAIICDDSISNHNASGGKNIHASGGKLKLNREGDQSLAYLSGELNQNATDESGNINISEAAIDKINPERFGGIGAGRIAIGINPERFDWVPQVFSSDLLFNTFAEGGIQLQLPRSLSTTGQRGS